ncbi:hypothetical protein JW823_09340 [bacterium]|nr:hypothetical protein [candidate division CSSED10-310 bacterium]
MNTLRFSAIFLALVGLLLIAGNPVSADNVTDLMKSAEQNYSAGKYSKALEDLDWVRTEIANLQLQEMKKFLPEEIDGMKGEDSEGGAIFGMHSVSKYYPSEDGEKSVKITIASGKSSQGGAGLGAIMGMAAAFGAMDASKQSKMVVEQGYKGNFALDPETKEGTLIINLNGGAMVNVETAGFGDESMAKKALSKLDLAKIDESLK